MTYFTLLTDCQNTFYWKYMQHTMGCGQGHPGTQYDYEAMSAVCWLLQHFLQQTSTVSNTNTWRWWSTDIATDSFETKQSSMSSDLVHLAPHIRAVSLQDNSHALHQQNDQAWTHSGHWQPSRSSWHRIWGQTMMTRAAVSATDFNYSPVSNTNTWRWFSTDIATDSFKTKQSS